MKMSGSTPGSRQLAFLVMTPTQTSKIFWLHLWLQPNHPKWFSPRYLHHSLALKLAPIASHYITFCAFRCVLQMHNVRMHGMRWKLLPYVEHKRHRNNGSGPGCRYRHLLFCSSSNNAKLFGRRFHSPDPWSRVWRPMRDGIDWICTFNCGSRPICKVRQKSRAIWT